MRRWKGMDKEKEEWEARAARWWESPLDTYGISFRSYKILKLNILSGHFAIQVSKRKKKKKRMPQLGSSPIAYKRRAHCHWDNTHTNALELWQMQCTWDNWNTQKYQKGRELSFQWKSWIREVCFHSYPSRKTSIPVFRCLAVETSRYGEPAPFVVRTHFYSLLPIFSTTEAWLSMVDRTGQCQWAESRTTASSAARTSEVSNAWASN